MYLTYEKYKEYGGNLPEVSFDEFEFEAASLIDWYTFNRLRGENDLPESVLRCMYKLIKLLVQKSELSSMGAEAVSDTEQGEEAYTSGQYIASQSNDGVSVSYNVISASEALQNSEKEIAKTINMFLSNVFTSKGLKLTYRGIYPGEERPYLEMIQRKAVPK